MDDKPPETKRLSLHDKAVGTETASVWVEILDTGDLEMSGVDSGPFAESVFGDEDIEWWLTVPVEHKDSVLLYLRQEKYSGDDRCRSGFRGWLEEHEIPHRSHVY